MNYSGFSKNSRLLFVEDSTKFLNSLGIYLQFSINARFLDVVHFNLESLPEDYYNYKIINGEISLIDNQLHEKNVNSIKQFSQELIFIKHAIDVPNRIYMESHGDGRFGRYVTEKIKSISTKVLSSHNLTKHEQNLFDYHKSKYDNVTDEVMAEMILTQINVWETKLDIEILNLLKKIDSNIAGGF